MAWPCCIIPIISFSAYPIINIQDMFALYMSKTSQHEAMHIY